MCKKIVIKLFLLFFTVSVSSAQFYDRSETVFKTSVAFPSGLKFDFSEGVIFRSSFSGAVDFGFRHTGTRYDTGFFADAEIYYPFVLGVNYRYGPYKANPCTYYDFLLGVDLFLGGYRIIKQDYNYKVPFGIGLHINNLHQKNDFYGSIEGINELTAGLGVWSAYEKQISDKLYFNAGVKLMADILRIKTTAMGGALETLFKGVLYFNLVPSFGIVVKI